MKELNTKEVLWSVMALGVVAMIVYALSFLAGCGGAVERGGVGETTPAGEKPDVSVAPTPQPPADGESLPTPPAFKGCSSQSCEKESSQEFEAKFCEPWHDGTGSATEPVWFVGYKGCCGTFPQAKLAPGMLIKGSLPYVFYYGSNGKKYRFPTHVELNSWYGSLEDFDYKGEKMCGQVHEFSKAVVDAIPAGGNVTFRPGVFVTGLPYEAKYRAVGQGRVLRLFATEEALFAVYGKDAKAWKIARPDGILESYNMGPEIKSAGDYDPHKEWETTIEKEVVATWP